MGPPDRVMAIRASTIARNMASAETNNAVPDTVSDRNSAETRVSSSARRGNSRVGRRLIGVSSDVWILVGRSYGGWLWYCVLIGYWCVFGLLVISVVGNEFLFEWFFCVSFRSVTFI